MKVRVSTTIPSARQYENIKTEYEGEMNERETMINFAKEDLRKLNGIMKLPKNTPEIMYSPKEGESCTISGVGWVFKNNQWNFEKENE